MPSPPPRGNASGGSLASPENDITGLWDGYQAGFAVVTSQEVDSGIVKLSQYKAVLPTNGVDANLTAYSVHPGAVATKLLRAGFGPIAGATPEQGARTIVRLAGAANIEEPTGTYFSDGVATPPSSSARDAQARERLWEASLRLSKRDG